MNQFVSSVLNRRASLMTLGAAGLKPVASSVAASAKKKQKKHGKKKRKPGDVNRRCTLQAEAWSTFVTTACAGDATCLEFVTCGEPLKTCNFTGFFTCFAGLSNF